MSHLSTDRLAALHDEPPSTSEAEHLAGCVACARAREGHRTLVALASIEQNAEGAPLTDWATLSARLREEGLIGRTPVWRESSSGRWLRAAAALLLVAGGIATGRLTAGMTLFGRPGSAAVARDRTPAPELVNGAVPVSADGAPPRIGSVSEALALIGRAERDYQAAATFLVENDGASRSPDEPDVFRARLAALDGAAAATRQALAVAPADPVINRYYLAAMGAREVTLRQLGTTLPGGARLSRY